MKSIPCLFLANPALPKIVETDASDLGYGGILKQKDDNKEQIIQYVSAQRMIARKTILLSKKKFFQLFFAS